MVNGDGPSSAKRTPPRSRPNHSRRPLLSRGPSQILLTALTSCELRQLGFDDWAEQLICAGSNVHRRGSERNASVARPPSPVWPAQAATAAVVTAVNLAGEIGAPTSCFIATSPHRSAGLKRSQFNAGRPAR